MGGASTTGILLGLVCVMVCYLPAKYPVGVQRQLICQGFGGRKGTPIASPERLRELPSLPCETSMRYDLKETGAILCLF